MKQKNYSDRCSEYCVGCVGGLGARNSQQVSWSGGIYFVGKQRVFSSRTCGEGCNASFVGDKFIWSFPCGPLSRTSDIRYLCTSNKCSKVCISRYPVLHKLTLKQTKPVQSSCGSDVGSASRFDTQNMLHLKDEILFCGTSHSVLITSTVIELSVFRAASRNAGTRKRDGACFTFRSFKTCS